MRVIAGSARSLKLVTPQGQDTRPTTDRIKETLFNMIQMEVPGARFLDLFCGSGGIGIEALSRGAQRAVFVDHGKEACECVAQNLAHTRLGDRAVVCKQDVFTALASMEYKETFDVIFMDPPYDQQLEQKVLQVLGISSILDEETLIIFEANIHTDIDYLQQLGYDLIKEKRYKTNKHVFVRRRKR